jgi:hypothetical protein
MLCEKHLENYRKWKYGKGDIKKQGEDGSYYWLDCTIVPFLIMQESPYQYISIEF